MIETLLSLLTLTQCVLIVCFMRMIHMFRTPDVPQMNKDVLPAVETPDEHPETTVNYSDLTENEILALEREQNFEERIMKMKAELASHVPARPINATVAEQFHPNVYNLPHNIINDTYTLPDVEIAD